MRLCIALRPDYWRQLVLPARPKLDTVTNASSMNSLQMQPVVGVQAHSDFFKFKTRLTMPSDGVCV